MDIKERLSFFQEMVQCEYPLHLWHYSPEFELIETDCPAELMLPDIISMLGFSSLVLAHIESGNRMPLILEPEEVKQWIQDAGAAWSLLKKTPVLLAGGTEYEQLRLF